MEKTLLKKLVESHYIIGIVWFWMAAGMLLLSDIFYNQEYVAYHTFTILGEHSQLTIISLGGLAIFLNTIIAIGERFLSDD